MNAKVAKLAELFETLKAQGVSERNAYLLLDELGRLETVREDLVHALRWFSRDLEQEATNLERGSHVNSLGVVQGRGASVDVKCAELQAKRESLQTLCRALGVEKELLGL